MKPEKQLSIRSNEAADLAAALAARTGQSQKEIVIEALRTLDGHTNSQFSARSKSARLRWERFQLALERFHEEVLEIEAGAGEKLTSNHDWMYDDDGLPK